MSITLLGAGSASSADTTSPTLQSATVATDGVTLTLVFSEAVTESTPGDFFTNWTVSSATLDAATVSYVSGLDTATVVGTVVAPALQSETVTVYSGGTEVEDLVGNELEQGVQVTATNNSTQTAPTVSSRTIQSNGTTLRVVFSAAVTGFSSGAEGFALTGLSGGSTTLTYSSGNNSTTVDFTISRTVYSSETGGVLAYTAGDIIKSSGGAALASFSNASVTNDSSQTVAPTVRNVSTGATSNGSTTLTLPTRSSGDTLVVFTCGANDPPAANTGWTRQFLRPVGINLMGGLAAYTRQSNGTDSTPFGANVSGDTGYIAVSCQSPSSGYDASASQSGSASTSIVAPTVTPSGSADLLLSAYLVGDGSTSITVPGSQTATLTVRPGGLPTMSMRVGYESLSSSSATGTRTATSSASAAYAAANLLVK